MKQKIFLLGLLFTGVTVWAAPTELQFVSTLSAPASSFKEVETKGSRPVVVGNGVEMNIGSSAASQGTIKLEGNALAVNHLYMEGKTTLQVADTKIWRVGQLYIGNEGNVSPKNLLVSTLNVGDSQHKNISLNLDANTLTTTGGVTAQTVSITSKLDVKHPSHPENQFIFSGIGTGEATGEATFAAPIYRTEVEQSVGHYPDNVLAILKTNN